MEDYVVIGFMLLSVATVCAIAVYAGSKIPRV